MLQNYLTKETVVFENKVETWEEALEILAKPLLNKSVITNEYIKNIKKNVNENGPYFVIDDYFALPHAEPGLGVNELGLSLLRLEEPVELEGRLVKVFLLLAAKDSNSHLQVLSEISELLMERKKFKVLLNGNHEQVFDLIN